MSATTTTSLAASSPLNRHESFESGGSSWVAPALPPSTLDADACRPTSSNNAGLAAVLALGTGT